MKTGTADAFLYIIWAYRGRFAPNFAYAATALARVALTLALSHKGRGDPLAVICT